MAGTWVTVGTLSVNHAWQTIDSPFVGGSLFRVKQEFSQYPSGYCLVTSEYTGAGKYGYERIYPTSRDDNLLYLPVPDFMTTLELTERKLAAKVSSGSRYFEPGWEITIERFVEEQKNSSAGGMANNNSGQTNQDLQALEDAIAQNQASIESLSFSLVDLADRLEAIEASLGSGTGEVNVDQITESVIDQLGFRQANGEVSAIKQVISPDQTLTFYVREGMPEGNSGLSATEAFSTIEEAVISLSATYEVAGTLIIDLGASHSLRCTDFPQFTGSGTIIMRGPNNQTQVTFVRFQGNTLTNFANWAALDFQFENVAFIKGDNSKFNFQGGKLTFKNVDFGDCDVEFDACRKSSLVDCVNSFRIRIYRSVFDLFDCKFTIEFFYSQIFSQNCEFIRIFITEACSILLQNPRINFSYFTQTAKIINSTVEFKRSWLTFTNLGSEPQTRFLIEFQSCNIKDFPSNVDVQGKRRFNNCSILKFVNCQAPQDFPPVTYDFSKHSFEQAAYAISLYNTAFLKDLTIIGALIFLDLFSGIGDRNYDNSQADLQALNYQQAIDELTNRVALLEAG